jgi:hypothetical protein
LRLETLHRLLQRVIRCQRPDKIFIIRDPRSQSGTESALSQSMNKVWQPQLCVYHKSFGEVCVAGDVQFKRASVDKVPVHDDAHATIVSWWHNADQQNATFNRHEFSSCKEISAVDLPSNFSQRSTRVENLTGQLSTID